MRKLVTLTTILIAAAALVTITPQGSLTAQPAKAKGVGAAYDTHCAKCHSKDGKGIESLQPPDFTSGDWQSKVTDKQLGDAIRVGKGVMPGYKDTLSASQITAMVKYVRAFGPKPAKKK